MIRRVQMCSLACSWHSPSRFRLFVALAWVSVFTFGWGETLGEKGIVMRMMRRLRTYSIALFVMLAISLSAGVALCQPVLELGSDTADVGDLVSVPLTLSSVDPVQGLLAAFEWDGSVGLGIDFLPGMEIADADFRMVVVEDGCADRDSEVHTLLMEKVFPRQATVASAAEVVRALAA